ncbi:pyruvate dehydrogenase E2 component (dihydrolipoamide acetyltransferase) [Dongia mobilis]|uniref:Acetyltransferase component of pyruvate dehydrogenase complex n=1 Tax=Dongia mobilis TaxID=578943 RepID=A0A4V3DEH9_9PROT|nr:pyruvate dehydrogenase complex dihydrolipoamide acetyltransferase [Dongia mobilis]TDQ81431.1 pyruvate dehydrogenase E2 component (dihydrolipoamide acetyltransferase) [Dongia mobilis]
MPINILMPALSPTMTEGNLARWLKQEGDAVKAGDVLAEIETDKATMEVEAVDEGTLARILVPGGTQAVKVNDVIAILAEEGEDAGAVKAPAPAAAGAPTSAPAPAAAPQPVAAASLAAPAARPGSRIIASPLARRIAQQQGIDLAGVSGSGPNGRIVRADVEKAPKGAAKPAAAAAPAVPAAAPAISGAAQFGEPAFDLVPHTSMRKTIARRLQESKQFVPHFYLTVDCEIDRLLKLREEVNAASPKDGPDAYKVSVNDFVVKACAIALKQVPAANASWSDDGVKMYKSADISVAVAIPNGLITPILRNADARRLSELSIAMKDLAGRAKGGKLKPEEYTGGSFSVSNLGMFGIKDFAAIINPPQSCILAVGAGEQRPVVRNGALAIATVMSCTLSVDHRVVDGAIGAEFLAAFKRLIEQPLGMLV